MPAINAVYAAGVAADRVLSNLDLNLLITLDVLLRERNLTRAAAQLGLSQPAVSAALARLRRHFGDPLLDRLGNRYELTPLASRLLPLTGPALTGVRRVFETTPDFEAASLEREFTVVTSDYAAAILGPVVTRRIAEEAPGVRLRLQHTTPQAVDNAPETLRAVDGLILPHGFLIDVPYTDLYQDRWVCIVSVDNAAVGDRLTLTQLGELPWVVLFNLPTAFAPSTHQLRTIGIEPRVEVVVDGFLTMPFLVAGTNRVALLQERLASRLAGPAGVRVLPCPFDVAPLNEAFWWHPMFRNDPTHAWLRHQLSDAGRAVAQSPVAWRAG